MRLFCSFYIYYLCLFYASLVDDILWIFEISYVIFNFTIDSYANFVQINAKARNLVRNAHVCDLDLSFSFFFLRTKRRLESWLSQPNRYYHYCDITVTVASLWRCSIGHRSALLNRLRRLISRSPVFLLAISRTCRVLFTLPRTEPFFTPITVITRKKIKLLPARRPANTANYARILLLCHPVFIHDCNITVIFGIIRD